MIEEKHNCHGCKWLSEYKEKGRGYCSMVERSKLNYELKKYISEHKEEYAYGRKELPSLKIRRPEMKSCELYCIETTDKIKTNKRQTK